MAADVRVCVRSLFFCFFLIITMSVGFDVGFDMNFYYGAGLKSLSLSLFWLAAILALVSMLVIDVSHIYLVRAQSPPRTLNPRMQHLCTRAHLLSSASAPVQGEAPASTQSAWPQRIRVCNGTGPQDSILGHALGAPAMTE